MFRRAHGGFSVGNECSGKRTAGNAPICAAVLPLWGAVIRRVRTDRGSGLDVGVGSRTLDSVVGLEELAGSRRTNRIRRVVCLSLVAVLGTAAWPAPVPQPPISTGRVAAVAFSPDGRYLAVGAEQAIRVLDAQDWSTARILEGHSGQVTSVTWSGDGRFLASGSNDATVRVWDPRTWQIVHVLQGHSGCVAAVAFSPTVATLITGSCDGTARLRDAETGALVQTLRGHEDGVTAVAFSPDGAAVASAAQGTGFFLGEIKLWSVGGGWEIRTMTSPGVVADIVFSPDGRFLASGSYDNSVRLWEVATGRLAQVFAGHLRWVTAVAFAPDASALASGSQDGTVRLWDLRDLLGH